MAQLTADDLRRVLQAVAGESLDPAFLDADLDTLGYDSLALLEAAARIHQRFGIQIADEDVFGLGRPRDLLDLVNGTAAGAR